MDASQELYFLIVIEDNLSNNFVFYTLLPSTLDLDSLLTPHSFKH